MVRRRAASPSPSAPVRSAPRPAPRPVSPPTSSFSRPAPTAPAPVHAPTPAPTMGAAAAPSQGPGLMAQMAATAGGVAIGSAVGHTVGHMITGGMGGSNSEAAQAPAAGAGPVAQQQGYSQACEFEWKQFIECTQNQSDVSLCNGFNEAFKQCKGRF